MARKGESDRGVPQGLVLGPTLWNIIYDFIRLIRGAISIAYVNDHALVVKAGALGTL